MLTAPFFFLWTQTFSLCVYVADEIATAWRFYLAYIVFSALVLQKRADPVFSCCVFVFWYSFIIIIY